MATHLPWRVIAHSWTTGRPLGEIEDLQSLRLACSLSRNPTLAIQTGYSDLMDQLVGTAELPDGLALLSAWRRNPFSVNAHGWDLKFVGPVLTTDESARSATIALGSAGAGWRLTKRIADNETGLGRTEEGLSFDRMDGGVLAASLITASNRREGNTWVRSGSVQASADVAIDRWGGLKVLSGAIDELGSARFDWVIDPVANPDGSLVTDATGLALGTFRAAPVIGENRTRSVVFEFGMGRHNLVELGRKRSVESLLNRATHVKAGDPQQPYLVTSADATSISELGLMEELISDSQDAFELRRRIVDAHVAVRKRPRFMLDCEPAPSHVAGRGIPVPLIDYNPGDWVTARGYWAGKLRANHEVRIYDVEVSMDATGKEEAKLGLYGE